MTIHPLNTEFAAKMQARGFPPGYVQVRGAVHAATREHERAAGEYQAGVASNPRASWRELARVRIASQTRTRYAAVY